jgi:hypothetical protein
MDNSMVSKTEFDVKSKQGSNNPYLDGGRKTTLGYLDPEPEVVGDEKAPR